MRWTCRAHFRADDGWVSGSCAVETCGAEAEHTAAVPFGDITARVGLCPRHYWEDWEDGART